MIEKRGTLGSTCPQRWLHPLKGILEQNPQAPQGSTQVQVAGYQHWYSQLAADVKSKQSAVIGLIGGIEYLFRKKKVDFVKEWGKIASPLKIDVDFCYLYLNNFKQIN